MVRSSGTRRKSVGRQGPLTPPIPPAQAFCQPPSASNEHSLAYSRRGQRTRRVTSVPDTSAPGQVKLGLVIDLDTCVGCQACATSCKEWNTQGYSAPLTDEHTQGREATGVWLNRVHGYEVKEEEQSQSRIVHFPRSCLHCEEPACVTVCPTGASYKRAEDGIVLVNPETCIGCKLCSWACPYGAREYDYDDGVMK